MSNEPEISLSPLIQIGQISVNVHDLARAAVFYKETLGLKHLFTARRRWRSSIAVASD
jgi:catechol-2,3-dioxygenase